MHQLLTPEQARAALEYEGKSIADFAREHRLSAPIVYQVLKGTKIGKYGQSHKAACLLRLKIGDIPPAIPLPPNAPYLETGTPGMNP